MVKKECIFCDIVNKKAKQSEAIVYQDKFITAFMDHIQPHKGHVLIIPNKHYENIYELDEKVAGKIFKKAIHISEAIKKTFKSTDINIYECNGSNAEQSVFHFHLHIFPRKKNDGLFKIYPKDYKFKIENISTLKKLKNAIKKNL